MVEEAMPERALPEEKRILIVEDEVLTRVVISEAAREAGYIVVEASDASAALAYLADGKPVDLVFTDIQLPGSVDGLELARRVRAASPEIRVLITSGNADERTAREVAPFLPKPYGPEEAIERIRKLLTPTE
jgi:CheY-like chemotaxis protein